MDQTKPRTLAFWATTRAEFSRGRIVQPTKFVINLKTAKTLGLNAVGHRRQSDPVMGRDGRSGSGPMRISGSTRSGNTLNDEEDVWANR